MDVDELNKARKKRVTANAVKLREVDPEDILPYLDCLTTQAKERIRCKNINRGQSAGADELFHDVVNKDQWFEQLIRGLRKCDYDTIADLLDDPQKHPHRRTEETDNKNLHIAGTSTSLSRHKKITLETLYKDLPSTVLVELKPLDVPSSVTGNDWTGLAGKLGFSIAAVQQLKQQKQPTEALLDEWSKEEGATLGKFRKALHDINRIDVCQQLEKMFDILPLVANDLVDNSIPSHKTSCSQPHQLKTAASSFKEANPSESKRQSEDLEPSAKVSVKKLEKDLPGSLEIHEPEVPLQVERVESSGNSGMPEGEAATSSQQQNLGKGESSPADNKSTADKTGWNVDKVETKHLPPKLDGSDHAKGTADKGNGEIAVTYAGTANPETPPREAQRCSNMPVNNLNRTSARSEMNVPDTQKYDVNCTGKTLVSTDQDAATTSWNRLISDPDGIIGPLRSKSIESSFNLQISSKSCSTLSDDSGSAPLPLAAVPNPQIQNGKTSLQRSSQGAPVQQPTETSTHTPGTFDVPSVDGTFEKDDLMIAAAYSTYRGSALNQVSKGMQDHWPPSTGQSDMEQITIKQLSPSAQSKLNPNQMENSIKGTDQSPPINNQQHRAGGCVNASKAEGATAKAGTVVDPNEVGNNCKGTGTGAGVDVGVGATGGEGICIGTAGDEVGTVANVDKAEEACEGLGTGTLANGCLSVGTVIDIAGRADCLGRAESGSAAGSDTCEGLGTVGSVGEAEDASPSDDGDKNEAGGSGSAGETAHDKVVGATAGSSPFDEGKDDKARRAGSAKKTDDDTCTSVGIADTVGAGEGDEVEGADVGAVPEPRGHRAVIGTVALAVPVVVSLAAVVLTGGDWISNALK